MVEIALRYPNCRDPHSANEICIEYYSPDLYRSVWSHEVDDLLEL